VYMVWVGKIEGKRPLERPRRKWGVGLEWTSERLFGGGGSVEWIHLAQDRDRWWDVVNAVMNVRVLGPRS
jgi:hypothetical protein